MLPSIKIYGMNPSKNTWLALLQGLFLIVVGLFFIFRPESALKTIKSFPLKPIKAT